MFKKSIAEHKHTMSYLSPNLMAIKDIYWSMRGMIYAKFPC